MWKKCTAIAFILTTFCVVKTFQMSDSDKERCLSSYTSLFAMKYFSLLSNEDNLYQSVVIPIKCNNRTLHGLLNSVFNMSMAINRLTTNFRHVHPLDVHFYELMENDSLNVMTDNIMSDSHPGEI